MTQSHTGTDRRFLGSPFDAAGQNLLHRMDYATARTSEPLHDESATRWQVGRCPPDAIASDDLARCARGPERRPETP